MLDTLRHVTFAKVSKSEHLTTSFRRPPSFTMNETSQTPRTLAIFLSSALLGASCGGAPTTQETVSSHQQAVKHPVTGHAAVAYGYDAVGQLTSAQYPSRTRRIRFVYDPAGNRTKRIVDSTITSADPNLVLQGSQAIITKVSIYKSYRALKTSKSTGAYKTLNVGRKVHINGKTFTIKAKTTVGDVYLDKAATANVRNWDLITFL
jgi:YD repeat-containing protein